MVNEKKVAIVGCGFVGSSSAFALMQSGLFSEMVLIDVDKNRAEGEALDIAHGMTFAEPMKIYAGDYSDVADAAMIVVTAGAAQKPGETRLDLVNKNVNIFKSIIPEIKKSGFDGILLIVSNPVDVLTYAAIKMSGLPEGHVIGSGTVLDTGRLQQMLGAHVEVDPRDVQAYVMGEHGDSEFVAWSSAQVAGVPLNTFCELHGHLEHEAARSVSPRTSRTPPTPSSRRSTLPTMALPWPSSASALPSCAMSRPFCPSPRSWWASMACPILLSPCRPSLVATASSAASPCR